MKFTKSLVKYYKKIHSDFKEDHIHQFRISFKKLRAILRLQKNSKILGSDIKSIYRVAGEIRNVQLVIKMLSPQPGVGSRESGVTKQLLPDLETLKKEWKVRYKTPVLPALVSDLQKLKLKPANDKHFFTKKFNKLLYLLFADIITDDMLHEARKISKDLQYAMEVCKYDKIHSKLSVKPVSLKTLKTIGKEIGLYNDQRMLIGFLYKFKPPKNDPDSLKRVYPLIAKKVLEKNVQKEKLIISLQSILESP